MNTSTWARWLIHAILMLMTALLGLTSACGDLLDDVAQDATTTDDDNDPCIAYDAETCEAHTECFAWWGTHVDFDQQCLKGEFITCETVDPTRGCNNGTPMVVGPNNTCWHFGDGCLPDGFREAGPEDADCIDANVDQLPVCAAE